MHRLSLLISSLALLLLAMPISLVAQKGQTLRIIKGKKVTLRADASHAVSFIWFKNGEPIKGQHDQRIVITDAAVYTVIALGEDCNSDLSDPLEIIVDPNAEETMVDIEIKNLPEKTTIWKDQEFNYQLLVLNNSPVSAHDITIEFQIPQQLTFMGATPEIGTQLNYDEQGKILEWKINELAPKAAIGQWIRLKGEQMGRAVTISKVRSKQQDSIPQNNLAESTINIVAFFIPNVITPNGDGKNDDFVIVGLELFKNVELRIFNRFGYEVYRAENYRNDWNGKGLSDGTYFYYIKIEDENGQTHSNKGYVTILHSRYDE